MTESSAPNQRKLVYYIACTVDGFIAREDGSFEDFLFVGPHLADLMADFPETVPGPMRDDAGVSGPNKHFDTVLMGRHTYEVGLDSGITNPYVTLQQYLFSQSMKESPDPAVNLVRSDALETVRRLKQEPGKDIWLCGGGQLASALAPELDELIVKRNPVIIGRGIPMFAANMPPLALELLDQKSYENGFLRLHYRVSR